MCEGGTIVGEILKENAATVHAYHDIADVAHMPPRG
jgi:hypothetical protein